MKLVLNEKKHDVPHNISIDVYTRVLMVFQNRKCFRRSKIFSNNNTLERNLVLSITFLSVTRSIK